MRYTLGELLGKGSVGSVYAARDGAEVVAVKVLHAALLDDPAMTARFAAEAEVARRVAHRCVVRVLDHGVDAGVPYLVMPRAPGPTLRRLIQAAGPLPVNRTVHIATQLLAGLAAIHNAGLVHGDLTSANVLVDTGDHDRVTVIDLGLARPVGEPAPGVADQMMAGTPEYMAPELLDEEPLSVAAEIFAAGAIVYEMMTGTTPYGTGSITQILDRHAAAPVAAPSARRGDGSVPAPLEHVVLRALAREPARRHLNADMFATALERAALAICEEDRPTRRWKRRCAAAVGQRQLLVARHLVEARRAHAAKLARIPVAGEHDDAG